MKEYKLYLNTPANKWSDATPIGCGSMGAMIFGGIACEQLSLNEEHIWASTGDDGRDPDFLNKIGRLRKLFLDGKPIEADRRAKVEFADGFTRICSYEWAGMLKIAMHKDDFCEDYRRDLFLNDGVARVSYSKDDSHYTREYFASYPDRVIVCRLRSDNAPLDVRLAFDRENILEKTADGRTITVRAKTALGNHEFFVKISVESDGAVNTACTSLHVTDTHECVIKLAISPESVPTLSEKSYDALLTAHKEDFRALMTRSDIELDDYAELEDMPTPDRMEIFRQNKRGDAGMLPLYFQFGRYLLVSSSRPGTLPANLQGVWSDGPTEPWSCDYHTNVNLQANYWPAEVANLSECHLPLFDYINTYLLESARVTAKVNYKARGGVVHHLSDIYGYTAPADGFWGLWPLGGAWLCYHHWEHYLFTGDKDFLRDKAYTFMRDCTLFFLDYLFEDKSGMLMSGPSASPENMYYVTDENGEKKETFLAMSPTMDVEVIGGLFRIFCDAAEVLGTDAELVAQAKTAISKLPPLKVGRFGQLCEWLEDYEETEPGHRHISHSFALYPDCAINRSTPELYKALGITLDRRLSYPAIKSGWTYAWMIGLFARLGRADDAYNAFLDILRTCTMPNLLDRAGTDSWAKIFQIDGNLGATGALCEMFLQSHEGLISVLPALPAKLKNGSFTRLCARGGIEVSAKWRDGVLCEVTLASSKPQDVSLELSSSLSGATLCGSDGKTYTADGRVILLRLEGTLTLTK